MWCTLYSVLKVVRTTLNSYLQYASHIANINIDLVFIVVNDKNNVFHSTVKSCSIKIITRFTLEPYCTCANISQTGLSI